MQIHWLYLSMYTMSYWGYILSTYIFYMFCTFFFIITTCPRCSSRQLPFPIIILLFFLINYYHTIVLLPKAPVIIHLEYLNLYLPVSTRVMTMISLSLLHTTIFLLSFFSFYLYLPVLAAAPDSVIYLFPPIFYT